MDSSDHKLWAIIYGKMTPLEKTVCLSLEGPLKVLPSKNLPGIYQRDQRLTWISKSSPKAAW